MPESEREVYDKLLKRKDGQIGDIADVFQGIRTSANSIYIVIPRDANRIESDDTGDTVTVSPIGYENRTYEVETDLLRPWLQGIDVQRWEADWTGRHVIHPYYVRKGPDGVENGLYTQTELKSQLPKTWKYFTEFKDELEQREGGRMEDRDDWYGYIYPKNLERFERPKMMTADMSDRARYTIDSEGTWYFAAPYGVQLQEGKLEHTDEIACQLNSELLDFFLKHISPMLLGGKYRYQSRYIHPLPYILDTESQASEKMVTALQKIKKALNLDSKTDRFPEAYLGDYGGELDYITYEWQTRRYPVNAEVQGDVDGEFVVQAGRTDTINDPAMYSDDREARKRRAEYVHAAVDGRNVKSGEEITIPIPRSDDGVEELLARLEADREAVAATNIDDLEAEIDQAVYDLFDLTDDERDVVEEYLEVF